MCCGSLLLMLNVLKIGFSSSYFMRVQDFSTVYVFKEVKYLYSWTYYVIKYVLFIYITTYMDIYVKKNSNAFFFFFMHLFFTIMIMIEIFLSYKYILYYKNDSFLFSIKHYYFEIFFFNNK